MAIPLIDPVYIFSLLLLLILIAPPVATKLRLPPIVVLIILGTIFGSNGIGILARKDPLILLERIGLLYIMLLAGIRMDLSNFKRVGIRTSVFGLLTFGIPFSIGFLSGQLLTHNLLVSLLLGILYSPHTLMAYPIVVNLGISQHEAVGMAVGGSVITTVLTLSGYAILKATQAGGVGILLWIKLLGVLPILIAACFWIIHKSGQGIAQESWKNSTQALVFVLTSVFLTASMTHLVGVDAIVGAFIAGLALSRLVPLNSLLMKQIELVGNSLFIPAFAISVGVLSNPRVLFSHPENLGIVLFVVAGTVVSKFLAAWIAARVFQYGYPAIMTMFGLTVSRSALVLVIALFGRSSNLLDDGTFNAIIVYIMVTCLAGPLVTSVWGKQIADVN